MLFKTPSIQVDKVERVEVHGRYHPFLEEATMLYLKEWKRHLQNRPWTDELVSLPHGPAEPDEGASVDHNGRTICKVSPLYQQ